MTLEFKQWLEGREDEFSSAFSMLNALKYLGIDVLKASNEEIIKALEEIGKIPPGHNNYALVTRLRMVAKGTFDPDQDILTRR